MIAFFELIGGFSLWVMSGFKGKIIRDQPSEKYSFQLDLAWIGLVVSVAILFVLILVVKQLD